MPAGGTGSSLRRLARKVSHFARKKGARRALDEGVKNEKIANFEVGEELRQINVSSLAEREEDATIVAHLTAEMLNISDEIWMGRGEEALPHMKYKN